MLTTEQIKKANKVVAEIKRCGQKRIASSQVGFLIDMLDHYKEQFTMTSASLMFIHDFLLANGIDMKKTPPMMYVDAINNVIFDRLKASGALPGHEATVKWVEVESEYEEQEFECVAIEKEEE